MSNVHNVYTSYHAMSSEITEALGQMAKICEKLGLHEKAESMLESRRKLQERKFSVGILGEFKRGKSTVINALLGQEIMPADIIPCSATMNRVTYDLSPRAEVRMIDGSCVNIAVEELANYVTKLDEESSAMAEKVEEAIVYYPCHFCQNGVDIVDTPGLNDDERMNKITEEIVPKLDAVIMVLVADNPFSMSEADFVRNKLMCSDVGRLIFLVNKIDTVRPKDREKALKGIRDKIQKTVLEKTEEVYGADSEQYRAVKSKLADIRIYPISAINALDGRLEGDEELLAESGVPEFEAALSRLLTEERGALELSNPVMKLVSMGPAVDEAIAQKIACMDMDGEAFLRTQQATVREIKTLREQKQEEKKNLKKNAHNLRAELSGKAERCYQEIETEANKIIDAMQPIGKMNQTDKEKLVSETMGRVERKINDVLAIHSERMIAEMNASVQRDSSRISADLFGRGIHNLNVHLNGVKLQNTQSTGKDLGIMAAGALIETYSPVFGVAGAIEGFRAAGVKGGAMGGVTGYAISYATAVLAVSIGAAALPAVILGALAGSVGGKAIVKAVFKKDIAGKELEKLKEILRGQVTEAIYKIRMEQTMEKWIQKEVSSQYEALIIAMEVECDKIIDETQRKITAISQSLTASNAQREAQRGDLEELREEINSLMLRLEPIYKKILAVPA